MIIFVYHIYPNDSTNENANEIAEVQVLHFLSCFHELFHTSCFYGSITIIKHLIVDNDCNN